MHTEDMKKIEEVLSKEKSVPLSSIEGRTRLASLFRIARDKRAELLVQLNLCRENIPQAEKLSDDELIACWITDCIDRQIASLTTVQMMLKISRGERLQSVSDMIIGISDEINDDAQKRGTIAV